MVAAGVAAPDPKPALSPATIEMVAEDWDAQTMPLSGAPTGDTMHTSTTEKFSHNDATTTDAEQHSGLGQPVPIDVGTPTRIKGSNSEFKVDRSPARASPVRILPPVRPPRSALPSMRVLICEPDIGNAALIRTWRDTGVWVARLDGLWYGRTLARYVCKHVP